MKKILPFLISLLLATAAAAADASLTGVWKIDSDTAGNVSTATLTLKQQDKKLTGTLKGADDQETPIKGDFDGKAVTLKFQTEWSGNQLDITYAGTIDAAGVITGSINVAPMGIEGTFTAKRAEAGERKK